MDTSIDMICTDTLPEQQDHGTPKQVTPMNRHKYIAATSSSSTLTPATMSSYSSNVSTPQFATTSTNRMLTPMNKVMMIPSPSRPRLDPRYASRLPIEYKTLPIANNSPKATSSSSVATSTTTTAMTTTTDDIISPPSLQRRYESGMMVLDNEEQLHSSLHQKPIVSPSFYTDTSSEILDISYESYSTTTTSDVWHPPTPKRTRPERNKNNANYNNGSICSDRYIPSRLSSNTHHMHLWDSIAERSAQIRTTMNYTSYNANSDIDSGMMDVSTRSMPDTSSNGGGGGGIDGSAYGGNHQSPVPQLNTFASQTQQSLLDALLRTEVLGENIDPTRAVATAAGDLTSFPIGAGASSNHLRFTNSRQHLFARNPSLNDPSAVVNAFSLTPMNNLSERLITTPNKRKRRISKVPFKVLDAPALQDDFYLNLVDWSSHNVLAVGLGACVYLWSACTSKVTKLCDLSINDDTVTAVSWAQRGTHLSVGTNKGEVQLWDAIKCKKVRSMSGHTARVGTLAWTGPILASGSRDRLIYLRDVRVQSPFTDKLSNHRQEVCGLKWSFEEPAFLASGGNDNNLHVFDSRNPSEPLHKFSEHTAAVKAIAWSPHQHGLLASGGGTADRCIRFHNTLSGASLNKIDTGSQVCNLAWSQNCNELVSTHGYSLNQIVVWRYPSMSKVTTLTGHTFRVLYLAMSPDGSTVVTGAGDETLRFWQIFPGPRSDGKDSSGGLLFPNTLGSVIR